MTFAPYEESRRLLRGRRALVTGAASGIGQGIAYELARHGAGVAITDVGGAGEAESMCSQIRSAGGSAEAIEMDVSSEQQVHDGFGRARSTLGGLDLVVNNAGVERRFDLREMPLQEWRRVIEINLTGSFLCAREGARMMLEDGAKGAIINITSVHEQIPWKGYSHYCASKGGLKLFAQSIARELAPHGIRVVNVAPGAIATPINRDVLADQGSRERVEEQIPLGRWGEVDDVASAVAWAASDEASYVVGSTIFVDGGMTLYPRFE